MSELHQPHSKFVISTLKERIEFTRAIFEITLPPEVLARIDLDRLRIEDGTFIGEDFEEDRTDVLTSVPGKAGGEDRNIFLLGEHKSTPEKNTPWQLLRYLEAIHSWQEVKRPVLTVVLYHGQEPWNVPLSLHEAFALTETQIQDYGRGVVNYEYYLLDIGRLDFEGLKYSLAFRAFLNILAWIRDSERISEFLRVYRDLFFEESEQKFVKKLLRYFYGCHKLKVPEFRTVIETNVSPEMGYLAMTTAEELIKEGEEKGILKGKLEMAKGLLEKNIPVQVVMETSGLTLEQLKDAKIIS